MKRIMITAIYVALVKGLFAQAAPCFTNEFRANTLKGLWVGEFVQKSCGIHEAFAMTLDIQRVQDSVVQGLFIWENLEDSRIVQTSLEGHFRNNILYLYETSLVKGEGVVLNGVYEIPLRQCHRWEGIWRVDELQVECNDPQTLTEGGRFILHKLQSGGEVPETVTIKAPLVIPTEFLTLHLQRIDTKPTGNLQLNRNGKVLLETVQPQRVHKLILPLGQPGQILSLHGSDLPPGKGGRVALQLFSQGQKLTEMVLEVSAQKAEGIRIRRP